MKCWMLRKICRKISDEPQNPTDTDDVSSSSPYNFFNTSPYYPYGYYLKPHQTVAYSKAPVPNTYFANPSWQYSYQKRPYPYYYPPRQPYWHENDIGLNPNFTIVEDLEKTTETTTTTEAPKNTDEPKVKGKYPVKVRYSYPKDSDVNTLSPLMFDYDQSGKKGYFGDRVYLSAVLPVSARKGRHKVEVQIKEKKMENDNVMEA